MNRCAIHPCRETCAEGHATCLEHRGAEQALLDRYVAHRAVELERDAAQQAQREFVASHPDVQARTRELIATARRNRPS